MRLDVREAAANALSSPQRQRGSAERWCCGLVTLTLLLAQPGGVARAARPPVFELRLADGSTFTGPLKALGDDWTLRLKGSKPRWVKGAEVISLRRLGVALPAQPGTGTSQVLFANGSRLPGTVLKIADDQLLFRPDFPVKPIKNEKWALPLALVSAVWRASPAGVANPRLLLRHLAGEARTRDVILRLNGDRIEGTLKGLVQQQNLMQKSFRIEPEGKAAIEVPEATVAVVAFNTELVSRARPRGIYGSLTLGNGARLVLTSARLLEDGETLRGRLPGGVSFDVPLDQVMALDLRQGCAVYLSDLKPLAYRHTPFFGVRWPYAVDASVAGRALRLGGSVYDKGLGLHSRSQLTYALTGGYRQFEALVGLDDRTGRRGRARVQVLLDGKPLDLGRDKELGARDRPLPIRVDVSKGRELTLVVDFGRFGDVQAHVDWADARLIR